MVDLRPSERIAAELRARIVAGDLVPGERLPSTRALVAEHGVGSATAARALALLRDQGWIHTRDRTGSVVVDRDAARARASAPPTRRRGPDRAELVAMAIELADTDGLAALTMRRLAASLGVPTMSLYQLVRDKDDLLLYMVETVFAAVPTGPEHGSWRTRLEGAARRQWRVHQRHPWLARVLSLSRPQPVPALLRLAEAELAALEEVVHDPVTRFDLHVALTSFVRGMAIDLAAEREAVADTGLDVDAWVDRAPTLHEALRRHSGPALRRIQDYSYDLQRIFDEGLASLLDGIAQRARRP